MSGSSTQTRQKSCVPCAKAKRKCDQGYPVCSRCVEKFLFCEYKSEAGKRRDENIGRYGDNEILMNYMLHVEGTNGHPNNESIVLSSNEQNAFNLAASSGVETAIPGAFDDSFFGAYENLVATNSYPQEIGTMDRERIRYAVRQLKSWPEKFVRFAKTPFIHPKAYAPGLPFCLQEACCASALYIAKAEANEAMMWDIIMTKANLLMESRLSWSVSEHLACVQALIIFQIIRLFDGDIMQRAGAEQHEDVLTQWTDQLSARTGATTASEGIVPSCWESWVFQESICRTLIASRMVQAMFSIQKKGFCTLVRVVTELSFTAQKTLWEAPSGQHWQREMKERSRYYCPRMDFSEIFSTAAVKDVDEMGLMMLVTYNGVDGINEWIAKVGDTALIE